MTPVYVAPVNVERLTKYVEVGDALVVDASDLPDRVVRVDLARLAAEADHVRALMPDDEDPSTLHLSIVGEGDSEYRGLSELTFQFCYSRQETDAEYAERLDFERRGQEARRRSVELRERAQLERLLAKYGKEPLKP